jgi:hypothetical protein
MKQYCDVCGMEMSCRIATPDDEFCCRWIVMR